MTPLVCTLLPGGVFPRGNGAICQKPPANSGEPSSMADCRESFGASLQQMWRALELPEVLFKLEHPVNAVKSLKIGYPPFPEDPKIKNIRDFERDSKFRARMTFSSEPPTAALFSCGEFETSILKVSSEI